MGFWDFGTSGYFLFGTRGGGGGHSVQAELTSKLIDLPNHVLICVVSSFEMFIYVGVRVF